MDKPIGNFDGTNVYWDKVDTSDGSYQVTITPDPEHFKRIAQEIAAAIAEKGE